MRFNFIRPETNPDTIRRTSTGQVGCTHYDCESRYGVPFSRNAAIEVIFYEQYGAQSLVLACANHRRTIRMQQGRGSYGYNRFTLSGLDPQQGDIANNLTSLFAAREQQARAQREAAEAERQRHIEENRSRVRAQYDANTVFSGRVETSGMNEYGLSYVSLRVYNPLLTSGQARDLARRLTLLADEVDIANG